MHVLAAQKQTIFTSLCAKTDRKKGRTNDQKTRKVWPKVHWTPITQTQSQQYDNKGPTNPTNKPRSRADLLMVWCIVPVRYSVPVNRLHNNKRRMPRWTNFYARGKYRESGQKWEGWHLILTHLIMLIVILTQFGQFYPLFPTRKN